MMSISNCILRFHRGGLKESLATEVEVNSLAELRAVIEAEWKLMNPKGDESIEVKRYTFDKYSDAIVHIVLWNLFPVGFLVGDIGELK